MKTIYVAHSMTNGQNDTQDIDALLQWLHKNGHSIVFPNYALFHDMLASQALESIKNANIVIADVSNYSHGVGFEIGFAYSLKKDVIIIANNSVKDKISKFILGLFPDIIFYKSKEDLIIEIHKKIA